MLLYAQAVVDVLKRLDDYDDGDMMVIAVPHALSRFFRLLVILRSIA